VETGDERTTAARHAVPSGPASARESGKAAKAQRTSQAASRGTRAGLRELLLLALVYVAYEGGRLAHPQREDAVAHARWLLRLESGWHVALERNINHAVSAREWLAVPACYAYAVLHFVVTPTVLVWLWRRHPGSYAAARNALVGATAVALLVYVTYPAAPPRLIAGFTDTMAQYQGLGWWSTNGSVPSGASGLTNTLAAMPSMHVGWALWSGWQILTLASSRAARRVGLLYPAFMVAVVVATANHYFVDAAAGSLLAAGGLAITSAGTRRPRQRPSRCPSRADARRTAHAQTGGK
jgi:hypothetical protein